MITIRDDDISYFTKVEELEKLYKKYYGKIKIIFSVTPFMVKSIEKKIKNREFKKHQLGNKEYFIGDNKKLIEYLKDKIEKNQIEIGLHGYNHKYLLKNNKLISEYGINNYEILTKKTKKGCLELKKLFNTNVELFIPPDNNISNCGIRAIGDAGIKLLFRAFPINLNTFFIKKINLNYFKFIFKRIYLKYRFNIIYNKKVNNGYTIEQGNLLYKKQNEKELYELYLIYKRYNLDFIIATHYWELLENNKKRNNLFNFINKILINEK